jgi:chorismate mutase
MLKEKILIAGPCSLESNEQIQDIAANLKKLNVKIIRASLFKPRTAPSFDGLKNQGIKILLENTIPLNLVPASEVLTIDNAVDILKELKKYNYPKMIFWIGSRNQNHIFQKDLANLLKDYKNIYLMIKNQMWHSFDHFLGIYEHIISTNFPIERLILCHRGFAKSKSDISKYKNIPDFELAKDIQIKTKTKMIIDPSHITGDKKYISEIIKKANEYNFDGYMLEVHDNPKTALTDKDQQLSIDEFDNCLNLINSSLIPL